MKKKELTIWDVFKLLYIIPAFLIFGIAYIIASIYDRRHNK